MSKYGHPINVHLQYYLNAADALEIHYELLNMAMARFQWGQKHWYIINTATPLNNVPSTTIARRKNLTYDVLKAAGIPVAEQVKLKSEEEAVEFWKEHKDIVIKPVRNLGGNGVTILPRSEDEVEDAFEDADKKNLAQTNFNVLGEKFATGTNYRVLVLGDEVLGVVRRLPAAIIGDGKSDIEELIKVANEKRKERIMKPILIDNELEIKLEQQGYEMDHILDEGQKIFLRLNANASTGGTSEECSGEIHDYYKEVCIAAVKAIGLKMGGVDLIADDITQPGNCVVNEVNFNPGLRLHYKVDKGEVVDVAKRIMEYIRDEYR